MVIEVKSEDKMKSFGELMGRRLCGGEVIELVGDVGAGKTTFVKGLARGLGVTDQVQSPSFTINRVYNGRDNLILAHYDFFRLNDAGVMTNEFMETVDKDNTVIVIEWADIISGVLPQDRLTINIQTISDTSRRLIISAGGKVSEKVLCEVKS